MVERFKSEVEDGNYLLTTSTGPQAAWVQKHRSSLCHCALCVQSASETGEKVKE